MTERDAQVTTLDTLRWQRVRDSFDRALDLDDGARARLLDALTTEDRAVADAVAELLQAHARHLGRTDATRAGLFSEATRAATSEPHLGTRIGAYVLERELGRGGMGVVYAARRVDGTVSQVVAIKVLQRSLLDAASLPRFRLERELIAHLAHPNIAHLFDAGETEDGSPYFIMELIDGVPLTAYCDRERLDLRARLHLFARIGEAVRHAHSRLILHRDLKPGNVLVDASGEPHLIDFGIARRLDADAAATLTAQRYFSPAHAAPEQLRGDAIGVACDVYQLGTVLYELLCGAPVFEFSRARPAEWEALILGHVPVAPSQRVLRHDDACAQARGSDTCRALSAQLRGDLDNLVLKALRKRPEERYASVERMLDDVHAYLDGRALQAGGGQAWYRLRKFVSRHRAGFALSGIAAISVLTGGLGIVWQAQVARQRAAELEQVAQFQAGMLEQVDPARAGKLLSDAVLKERARVPLDDAAAQTVFDAQWLRLNATDIALRLLGGTVLDPAIAEVDRRFVDQPEVDARLRATLARAHATLGLNDKAQTLQQQVVNLEQRLHGAQSREALRARVALGRIEQELGEFERAEALLAGAYADSRAWGTNDRDALETANEYANLRLAQGRREEAIAVYEVTLSATRRVLGDNHPSTLDTMNNLAVAYWEMGQLARTEPLLREVLSIRQREFGEDHHKSLLALSNVGALERDLGRPEAAEATMRVCLERYRDLLGSDHPRTLIVSNMLALMLSESGRLEEANALNRAVLSARRRTLGNHHPETATSSLNQAALLLELGQPDAAEPFAREAVAMFSAAVGGESPFTRIAQWRLGDVLTARGAATDAMAVLVPMEKPMRDLFAGGDNGYRLARYLHTLGRTHAALGQTPQALARVREACAIFAKTPGPVASQGEQCQRTLTELEAKPTGG
jgi:tetratricopeptide (TPR) repeat protein